MSGPAHDKARRPPVSAPAAVADREHRRRVSDGNDLQRVVLGLRARIGNRATSAALAPAASRRRVGRAARSLQRFGIDDRQWDDVTKVTHLSKAAYEVSTDPGERLVLKQSGSGAMAYRLGEEGPVQEALGAAVGAIPELDVRTAKTVLIETAGPEGRAILARLAKLGPTGLELATALSRTEVFLVMERAPGQPAERAGEIVAASSPAERMETFRRLGRLWAFDVLINNTDRFYAKNWGNVILGPASSVVGIDQMIGGTSADAGAAFADLEAESKLARVLNPGARRKWAIETFESVSEKWGPGGAAFEGEFVLHFELGAVEGIAAIAAMGPGALDHAKEQMPELVGEEVAKLGLGGAAVIQATFAKAADAIGRELEGLGAEIGQREKVAGPARVQLAVPRARRDAMLDALSRRIHKLDGDWAFVNTRWTGKDKHWATELKQLAAEAKQGFDAYVMSTRVDRGGGVGEQLDTWMEGLIAIIEALRAAGGTGHDDVKAVLAKLLVLVSRELADVPRAERVR